MNRVKERVAVKGGMAPTTAAAGAPILGRAAIA